MRFERYFEPTSINECSELLKTYGQDARMLAGGTDIVPKLKNRVLKIKAVIGLGSIPEINSIKRTESGVEIGSMVTLRNLSKAEELNDNWLVVKEAAGHVSSMQVRNVATIGGNACNASPSADAIQGLIVMDAVANIAGPNGVRKVDLIDFFVGPGKTVLEEGEILTGFTLPVPKENTGAVYKKFGIRGDTDISIVGVGSKVTLDSEGKVADAVISLAAVAPRPVRATEAEKHIIGKVLTDELVREAAEMAGNGCSPITDQRATKEYRLEMVKVWTRHALKEAHERAQSK